MGRRKKRSFLYRTFRSLFAVLILGGSLVVLSLGMGKLSSLISSYDFPKFISVGEVPNAGSVSELDMGEGASDLAELANAPKVPKLGLSKYEISVAILADSENDWENLRRGLNRMADLNPDVAVFLGDLTRFGSREELQEGKEILDTSGIELYVLPGDHDLADSVAQGDLSGRRNFMEIFGTNKHIYENSGQKFLLFDNSPNFTKVSEEDMEWFKQEVENSDFVFLSQPLYHPTNNRVMGIFEGEEVATVRAQALEMLESVRASTVKAVIAADQHSFSNNADPAKPELRHIVTGALVSNSEGLRNPQSPRFTVLGIYPDGEFSVDQVVL